jgi:sensor histidine kinase YesM
MNDEETRRSLKSPDRRYGWLIHPIGWGVLFTFPFLFTGREPETTLTWNRYAGFLIVVSSYVIVFYVNYLYLVKRYLFTKQFGRYLLNNALLFIVLMAAVHFLLELFFSVSGAGKTRPQQPDAWLIVRFFVIEILIYIFVIAISIAYKMTQSWYIAQAERKELERTHSEAELKNLKSQLNPHFLFNTLNNIYSLIDISPARAQEVVHELSRLLRYVLYDSTQLMVTIEKDMDFIRNYVELMRIRLSGHVSVNTSLTCSSPDIPVAPLLFIALIENALKHGVSNGKPSFIRIEINASGEAIDCRICNSYFPKNENDKSGSGIGLSNLRRRLDLLYPGSHTFTYGREGDEYRCELKLRPVGATGPVLHT